jgi:hypothetical protein
MLCEMRRDTAEEKAGQRLVVATAVGVGCACGFVVGADAAADDVESLIGRVMREIPKCDDQMGMMRPARFWQRA